MNSAVAHLLEKLNGVFDTLRLLGQGRAESWKSAAAFLVEKINDGLPRLLDVFPLQRLVERVGRIESGFPILGSRTARG